MPPPPMPKTFKAAAVTEAAIVLEALPGQTGPLLQVRLSNGTLVNVVLAAGTVAPGLFGGPITIPYAFDADQLNPAVGPADGGIHFNQAVQLNATILSLAWLAGDNADWSSVTNTMADSTSTIKGKLRVVKVSNPSIWILYNVLSISVQAGWTNVGVSAVGGSGSMADGDSVVVLFGMNGDKGA